MRPLRIAMAVVDGNDVAPAWYLAKKYPSPAVHPAIQGLIDGLSLRDDVECHVLYGSSRIDAPVVRRQGAVVYTGLPYRRIRGVGGALVQRFRALSAHLDCLEPDLVHGQGTERESALVAALSRYPSVVTLHGNFRALRSIFTQGPQRHYYQAAAFFETVALQRVGAIFCISQYVEDLVRGFPCRKFRIPNPVPRAFLGMERPAPADRPVVCCMGSVDVRKRTLFILRACEILWERGNRFVLKVYGHEGRGQPYFDEFQRSLEPWVARGMASWEGYTNCPEVAVSSADIMVSASCEESFGMNVLEAMAVGTPVVAPQVGGIRDIIEEGETGLMYPADAGPAACAEAISRLLGRGSLWQDLSRKGKERATARFSAPRIAEQTVGAYHAFLLGKDDPDEGRLASRD